MWQAFGKSGRMVQFFVGSNTWNKKSITFVIFPEPNFKLFLLLKGRDPTKPLWFGSRRLGGKMRSFSHPLHGPLVWIGHAGFRPENQRWESDQVYADAQAHVLRSVSQTNILPEWSGISSIRHSFASERRRYPQVSFHWLVHLQVKLT